MIIKNCIQQVRLSASANTGNDLNKIDIFALYELIQIFRAIYKFDHEAPPTGILWLSLTLHPHKQHRESTVWTVSFILIILKNQKKYIVSDFKVKNLIKYCNFLLFRNCVLMKNELINIHCKQQTYILWFSISMSICIFLCTFFNAIYGVLENFDSIIGCQPALYY